MYILKKTSILVAYKYIRSNQCNLDFMFPIFLLPVAGKNALQHARAHLEMEAKLSER